jgi:hypothetical protein
MTIETYLDRGEDEIPVTVEFDYYGASRGSRDRFGAPLEPDEDEYVEVTSVTDSERRELLGSLSNSELETFEQRCLEDVEAAIY